MKIKHGVFFVLLSFAIQVIANDYPTNDRVSYVLGCFQELGRNTMDDLQTCSCRIDAIASSIPFEQYSYAETYERNKRMTGEKGGVFRGNASAKAFTEKLNAAKQHAENQCKKVVRIEAPTDLTQDKRFDDVKFMKE